MKKGKHPWSEDYYGQVIPEGEVAGHRGQCTPVVPALRGKGVGRNSSLVLATS